MTRRTPASAARSSTKGAPPEPGNQGAKIDAEANDPLFVSALARGMAILRYCGEAQTDLTVSDIAHHLGMVQSTAWRSCYTLIKLGYLVKVSNDRVRPGLPLLGLGYATLSRQPIAELARPVMEEIAQRLPGAVSLGVREGFQILYLQRVEGGPVIYPGLRPGSRVTLLASAMGWAYVAAMPSHDRRQFLAQASEYSPELFARIKVRLMKAIRDFDEDGYIVNSGLIHPELSAIAFPIGLAGELPKAALSFGGPKDAFSLQRLKREVAPKLESLARMLSIAQG